VFAGYETRTFAEIEEEFSDFLVLVCFGSSLSDVMADVAALSEKRELYIPDVPVAGGGLFDEKYTEENAARIKKVQKMLADDKSRELFGIWTEYRFTGKFGELAGVQESRGEILKLLDIKQDGSENYIDVGAYDGDTVDEFMLLTGDNFGRIIAFEPDRDSIIKFKRRFWRFTYGHEKVQPVNAAAWSGDCELQMCGGGGRGSRILGAGGNDVLHTRRRKIFTVQGKTVDGVCEKSGFAPTLIKFDTEGAEREALLGAGDVIRKYKPRLTVAVYHRTEDMLDLPLLIHDLNYKYKICLRCEPGFPPWGMNYYCV